MHCAFHITNTTYQFNTSLAVGACFNIRSIYSLALSYLPEWNKNKPAKYKPYNKKTWQNWNNARHHMTINTITNCEMTPQQRRPSHSARGRCSAVSRTSLQHSPVNSHTIHADFFANYPNMWITWAYFYLNFVNGGELCTGQLYELSGRCELARVKLSGLCCIHKLAVICQCM